MDLIASQDNKIYKHIAKLSTKKYRDYYEEFIAEGINLVREAVNNDMQIVQVVLDKDVYENRLSSELVELLGSLTNINCNIITCSTKLFQKISETGTPQGILAVTKKKKWSLEAVSVKQGGNIIVLDRLQDPGNIGTILRTADGGGYAGAFILKGTVDIYSSKVVRAAAGSLFRFPVVFFENPKTMLKQLKDMGKIITCADIDGTEDYYNSDLKNNTALVIGNEGNGICEELLSECQKRVRIPMKGSLESLNASVAAGILIYESMRG